MSRKEGNPKHRKYGTRFYIVWRGMKERCLNPNNKAYKYYGGKGVTVCDAWLDAATFMQWCEEQNPPEGYRLERDKNDQGYCPENCRFIPESDQHRNQSSNIIVMHHGKPYVFIDLVRELNVVSEALAYTRFNRGWTPYRAASTPARAYK